MRHLQPPADRDRYEYRHDRNDERSNDERVHDARIVGRLRGDARSRETLPSHWGAELG